MSREDETNSALKLLGHSIGIVALGKKIVLIEGDGASLDKQTYGAILESQFPELVLVSSGGRRQISSFATVIDKVLNNALWGVEFFMLCDQDAVPMRPDDPDLEAWSRGRLRTLKRYHLENYFLSEDILHEIFGQMGADEEWLSTPTAIRTKLEEIARELAPYATALMATAELREEAGNVSLMPKGVGGSDLQTLIEKFLDTAEQERDRISAVISAKKMKECIEKKYELVRNSIENSNGEWKKIMPGRPILHTFAQRADIPVGRLKFMYIQEALKGNVMIFQDIIDIFQSFSTYK